MSLWICIGALLLIIEMLSATFFMLFFSLAAFSTALILYCITLPLHFQILAFSLLTALYFLFLRKVFRRKKVAVQIDNDLLHRKAIVHEAITPSRPGKVLIGDTLWVATSSQTLIQGQSVKILSLNNLTVEVQAL